MIIECNDCEGKGYDPLGHGELCLSCGGCGKRCTECGAGDDFCWCDEGGGSA